MKEFETENIFIASVLFGFNCKNHLVIAENKEEVQLLIEEIYYKPEIQFIIGYDELVEIYNEMKNTTSFCLVIEMIRHENHNQLIHYYEKNQNLIDVRDKYLGKDCVFIPEDMMIEIFKFFQNEMTNSKNKPLISKSYTI